MLAKDKQNEVVNHERLEAIETTEVVKNIRERLRSVKLGERGIPAEEVLADVRKQLLH